jgi:carboxymethylenebutenolidase
MADMVEFPSNGSTARGYLALPDAGTGPGVIVVQEWWGLDSGTKEMADRLAAAGFVALAPDLYHGELAAHDEMDRAGQLMQELPIDRAARDMSGAVDFLADHQATTGDGIGVVGFCMGGMLTFVLAAERPDRIKAAVPFYGFPPIEGGPADLSKIEAAIQGHMAEHDDFFPPEQAAALEAHLLSLGKDVTITVHPGTGHAFMAPHNALGTQDEAKVAEIWPKVTAFLHDRLGLGAPQGTPAVGTGGTPGPAGHDEG